MIMSLLRHVIDAIEMVASRKQELLVVVFAFEKFLSYLLVIGIILHTDHSALKYLMKKKDVKLTFIR